MAKRFFILMLLLSVLNSKGQIKNRVGDIMYDSPDELASYGKTPRDVLNFIANKLVPVIQTLNCTPDDSTMLETFTAILIIDRQGQVDSVCFPDLNINLQCREGLKNEFLKMTGWNPGKINGKTVRSKYTFHISCMLPQEQ